MYDYSHIVSSGRDCLLWVAAGAAIVAMVAASFVSPVAGLVASVALFALVGSLFRLPAVAFVVAGTLLLVVASVGSALVHPLASIPLRLGGIAFVVLAGMFHGTVSRPVRPHSTFIGLMLAGMGIYLLFATFGDGQYLPFAAEVAALGAFAIWLLAASSWVPAESLRSGLVVALAVAVAANVAAVVLAPGLAFGLGRLRGFLENANGLGCYAVALGMLSLTVVRGRLMAGVLYATSVAIIAATGSRASAAALLVTTVVIVLIEFRWPVKIGCLMAAGILMTLVVDLNPVIEWVMSRGNTREQTFEYAFSTLEANLWTGVGMDNELHEVASSPMRAFVHAGMWGGIAVVAMWVGLLAYGVTAGAHGVAVALGIVTLSCFEGVLLSPISPFLLVLTACLITVQRTVNSSGGRHRYEPRTALRHGRRLAGIGG